MSELWSAPREEMLDAWVDGHVDSTDPRVLALREDPGFEDEAQRRRAQNRALREAFAGELDEPVPMRLVLAALGGTGSAARADGGAGAARPERARAGAARDWLAAVFAPASGRPAAIAATVLAAAVLGAAGGWVGRGAAPSQTVAGGAAQREPIARAAAIAYATYAPEVRHPVEVAADERDHLVAWLSKRLGTKLTVPSLDAVGLRLVGGRLLPDDGSGVAAMFMFEDPAGRRMTLLVRRDAPGTDTAFRVSERGGVATFHWLDRGFGYALSGEFPRETMLAAATAVYRQLNP